MSDPQARMSMILTGALVAGVICGLFPLAAAALKNRFVIGFVFLAICIFMGIVGGFILGIPTAAILCVVANLLPHREMRPEDVAPLR